MIDVESLPSKLLKMINTNEYSDIYDSINLPLVSNKVILNCMEKINLSNYIKFSYAKNIDKELVHKIDSRNVLIKKQEMLGKTNIFSYLADVKTTPELNLDHVHYGYVEALLISEATRQAAMATILTNLDDSQQFFICEEFRRYHKLISRGNPVTINVIEIDDGSKLATTYFTLFQNSVLCSSGYIIGYKRGG